MNEQASRPTLSRIPSGATRPEAAPARGAAQLERRIALAAIVAGLSAVGAACEVDQEPRASGGPPASAVDGSAGEDTDLVEGGGRPPAYLITTTVESPDGSKTYLHVLPNLNPQTIDPAKSLELSSGFLQAYVYDGQLFVWTPEDNILQKYVVNDDRTITPGGRLSFANVIPSGQGALGGISPTRAFAADVTEGVIVQWNPTTMEIEQTLDLDVARLARGGFPGRDPNSANFQYVVGGHFIVPLMWAGTEITDVYQASGFLRVPLDDWTKYDVLEDTRCGLSTAVGQTSDGTLVFGGDLNLGSYRYWGPKWNDAACLLRTTASGGAPTFDATFVQNVLDFSEGQPPSEMRVLNDTVYLNTVDRALSQFDEQDPATLYSGRRCTAWVGKLGDSASFRKRADLQSFPGECVFPVGAVDGKAYLTSAEKPYPEVSPITLNVVTETGKDPSGIVVHASALYQLVRIR